MPHSCQFCDYVAYVASAASSDSEAGLCVSLKIFYLTTGQKSRMKSSHVS